MPPTSLPAPSAPSAPLTTAQIVALEPSVAFVKGHLRFGTGFLVSQGVVATNAHVIDEEFISNVEVRFPSAPAGQQGPLAAELLNEDPARPCFPGGFLRSCRDRDCTLLFVRERRGRHRDRQSRAWARKSCSKTR